MKRKRFLFSLGVLMLCLSLLGCGGGGGSSATIRGQVLIDGKPARSDQVYHYVWANDKAYGDT